MHLQTEEEALKSSFLSL